MLSFSARQVFWSYIRQNYSFTPTSPHLMLIIFTIKGTSACRCLSIFLHHFSCSNVSMKRRKAYSETSSLPNPFREVHVVTDIDKKFVYIESFL